MLQPRSVYCKKQLPALAKQTDQKVDCKLPAEILTVPIWAASSEVTLSIFAYLLKGTKLFRIFVSYAGSRTLSAP